MNFESSKSLFKFLEAANVIAPKGWPDSQIIYIQMIVYVVLTEVYTYTFP